MFSHKTRMVGCSILFGLCLLNSAQANAQTARIERTVRRVCRPQSTDVIRNRAECMADLSGQLLAKINSPTLTAQWHGRAASRG